MGPFDLFRYERYPCTVACLLSLSLFFKFVGVWNLRQLTLFQIHSLCIVLRSANTASTLTVSKSCCGVTAYCYVYPTVYIFNPSSYTPLAVYSRLVEGRINGALFRRRKAEDVDRILPNWLLQSELFFLDSKQV